MKKFVTIACAMLLGISACIASESATTSTNNSTAESYSSSVSVPTGTFFNGYNFIKIESTWLRIVIGGQMREYSFNAQKDPHGNYALTFGDGESITIYPNGRTLYYNGTTYSKKN